MKTKVLLLVGVILLISLVACGSVAGNLEPAALPTETVPPQPTETPPTIPTEAPKAEDIIISGQITVAGTATDQPLPAGNQVIVQIQDTGRADAAAIVLGQQVITDATSWPVAYTITVEAALLETAVQTTVSVRVEDSDGNLIYINDTVHPVAAGATAVNVIVIAIALPPPGNESALLDQIWQWNGFQDSATGDESNNIAISDPEKYTVALRSDGTYHIQADCNMVQGNYTLDNSSLTLQPGITTLAECGPDSHYDTFLAQLGNVGTYVFDAAGNLVFNLKMDAGNMLFSQSVPADDLLVDTEWVLSGLVIDDSLTMTDIDAQITAVFKEGQLTGSAGCNNYFASYELNGTQLTFSPIGSTRMACDEARNQREFEFLTALQTVAGYQLNEGTLELLDEAGVTRLMLQAPTATAVPEGLRGVWQWERFDDMATGDEGNNIAVADSASYTLALLPDGSYHAQADCNVVNGGYFLEGSSLTLNPGITTLAECGPDSLYNTFLARLSEVVAFVFDAEGNLVLNLQMDGGNMVFSRQ